MLGAALLILGAQQAYAGPLSGAIYTSLVDGSGVNSNIYEAMEDVYLHGGPGPNAPPGAGGLPEGDYYFQVTDPSGKVLLSMDPVRCRKVHVNSYGVMDYAYPATCVEKVRGKLVEVDCTHDTGIDLDHPELGAISVQLMPYERTPNKGGVYKVWITPVDMFVGDIDQIDNPEYYHGFIPGWSKTDCYKVRRGRPFDPPLIIVLKFDDSNANGIWDEGETEIDGWRVDVTDPLSVTNIRYTSADTPTEIQAMPEGIWVLVEELRSGWLQTALEIDGETQTVSSVAQVEVLGLSGEIHEVIFGNIQLGSISACKFYDRNANGINDSEPPVAGIRFLLDGIDVRGDEVHLVGYTGENGCVIFADLLPGNYTLTEVLPPGNWAPTTDISVSIALNEGGELGYSFGNICVGEADFSTKGYWHNKNGLNETVLSDFAYLNSLLPWLVPSSYFDAGDEPIDGLFADGTLVPAARNVAGELIASEGTPWAEQSHFLVDRNAEGDPREQLAQQLDAFIMNIRHRVDGNATIQLPDGQWIVASDLIAHAIGIWAGGTAADQTTMGALLDALNNSDAVAYVHYNPCPVIYP